MELTRETFNELPEQELGLITVPQWGDATVYVRLLTALEVDELERHNPETAKGKSQIEFTARICAAGMCDKTGARIVDDFKPLMKKSPAALIHIAQEIFKHNGLSEPEKN